MQSRFARLRYVNVGCCRPPVCNNRVARLATSSPFRHNINNMAQNGLKRMSTHEERDVSPPPLKRAKPSGTTRKSSLTILSVHSS